MKDGTFKLKFSLIFEWRDHRLEFRNLKKGPEENVLNENELKDIWSPVIYFENTQKPDTVEIKSNSNVRIILSGNFSRSSINNVEEFRAFKGNENSLLWTEHLFRIFECKFNLKMFPFDVQVNSTTSIFLLKCVHRLAI